MESRKVQRVGTSTLSVSLPKEWVESAGVRKGDILLLETLRDGTLRLLPQGEERTAGPGDVVQAVDADLAGEDGLLGRVIVGNYVLGRNTLRIRSARRLKHDQMREIRDAVDKLLGLGILEETPREVVLQCSLDPSRFPVETLLKRLYTLGSTMQREALDALERGDAELAREAIAREDEADEMYWLTLRLLLAAQRDSSLAEKVGLSDQLPIVGNRLIARNLEQVADYAEQAARSVLEILEAGGAVPADVVARLRELSDVASKVVSDALAAVLVRDVQLANDAIRRSEDLEQREDALMRSVFESYEDPERVAALRTIAWSLRRIAEYGSEIALTGINRYLERPSDLCEPLQETGP